MRQHSSHKKRNLYAFVLLSCISSFLVLFPRFRDYDFSRSVQTSTILYKFQLPPKQSVIVSNSTLPNIPEDPIFKEHRLKCIRGLQNEYRSLIGGLIKNKHAILVDTVDHENLGDSFIQVGEVLLMKEFNSYPSNKTCTLMKCDLMGLRREATARNNTVILIHGGGNLGDIWRASTTFKSRIMYYLSTTPIVLLPQSIFYNNLRLAKYDSTVFARHSNMRLFVRDNYSLNFSSEHFPNLKPALSPDAAFMIGPIDNSRCRPSWDVMFLARTDIEKRKNFGKIDWATTMLSDMGISYLVTDWFTWAKIIGNRTMPVDPMSRPDVRLEIGIELLCKARVIITDRLHVVILSTLMGLPHVFLDNIYGKVNGFRNSIFGPREDCQNDYVQGWPAVSWVHAATLAGKIISKAGAGR